MDDVKSKMSLLKKGKKSPRKGVKLSQETKDKISNSKKGVESKRLGKKLTEEHRLKIQKTVKENCERVKTINKINKMEVTGKIKVVNPEQQVSASFKKRELVISTSEEYPQHILVEFAQDKCDLLNNYNIGEAVKVSINLRGREWVNPQGETRYFNSVQGWRIEKMADEAPSAPMPSAPAFAPATNLNEEEEDLLPF